MDFKLAAMIGSLEFGLGPNMDFRLGSFYLEYGVETWSLGSRLGSPDLACRLMRSLDYRV